LLQGGVSALKEVREGMRKTVDRWKEKEAEGERGYHT
jgi:hypothetical protein